MCSWFKKNLRITKKDLKISHPRRWKKEWVRCLKSEIMTYSMKGFCFVFPSCSQTLVKAELTLSELFTQSHVEQTVNPFSMFAHRMRSVATVTTTHELPYFLLFPFFKCYHTLFRTGCLMRSYCTSSDTTVRGPGRARESCLWYLRGNLLITNNFTSWNTSAGLDVAWPAGTEERPLSSESCGRGAVEDVEQRLNKGKFSLSHTHTHILSPFTCDFIQSNTANCQHLFTFTHASHTEWVNMKETKFTHLREQDCEYWEAKVKLAALKCSAPAGYM